MLEVTWFEYPSVLIWWQLALYSLAVAWGAFMIGCFGVGGGAIFTSLLLLLPGMTPTVAAGSVFLGVLPMSLARMLQLLYFGRLSIGKALPLMLGALFGALLGQLALPHLPIAAVAAFVAALTIWAGVQMHHRVMKDVGSKQAAMAAPSPEAAKPTEEELDVELVPQAEGQMAPDGESSCGQGAPLCWRSVFSLNRPTASLLEWRLQALFKIALGLVASFISSVSGTGGPLIIFPCAMMLEPETNLRSLVAMSVPFTITLVFFSALGALLFGQVDLGLSSLIGGIGIVFNLIGGLLMERMGDAKLRAGLGAVLVFVGLALAAQTAAKLVN